MAHHTSRSACARAAAPFAQDAEVIDVEFTEVTGARRTILGALESGAAGRCSGRR